MLAKQEQDTFYNQVGVTIKSSRIKAGVKQEELSKHLGFVSRISIANIEAGKQKVQLHTLVEIAEYLKVPMATLIPSIEKFRKDVDPVMIKKIQKEILDAPTVEKIKGFIRYSAQKK